jgi:dTDP-4-dehydrorhamnose reductase
LALRKPEGENSVSFNLDDPRSIVAAIGTLRPDVVIHSAAMAQPDECEREPERARRINFDATKELAALCHKSGSRLIHLSTDLVFDGAKSSYVEEDQTFPISEYGRLKLAAEWAIMKEAPDSVILRVASVYGRPLGTRSCYIDELRSALSQGKTISAFVDQWRTATAGDQLGEVLCRLLQKPSLRGVFHWGGAERASRYETALALCRVFGFDENLVLKSRAADKKFVAPRPVDTSLDSSRLAAALKMKPWTLEEGFRALKEVS